MAGRIASSFKNMQEKFGDARPDQTGDLLGVWPAEGEHECYITKIEVDENAEFFVSSDDDTGKRVTIPATMVRFWYALCDDPDNPENPLNWGGQWFTFPEELTDEVPDNRLTMLQMDRNRFCGHMKCMLNVEIGGESGLPEDEALEQARAKLTGTNEIIAVVKIQHSSSRRKKKTTDGGKPAVFRKEFLQKLLAE